MSDKVDSGVSIGSARRRFAQWRRTRSPTKRIPDQLWELAIQIARRDGVNRTARALGLDGGKLKRLLMAANSGSGGSARRPQFVELIAPDHRPVQACVIEFEASSGTKMRIQWHGAAPDWTNLLRAWRDVEK